MRLAAVSILALFVILFVGEYVDGRRKGEWNPEANLYYALACAALALLGWWRPRAGGFVLLSIAALGFLSGLAFGGLAGGFVLGGIPTVVAFLLLRAGSGDRASGTTS